MTLFAGIRIKRKPTHKALKFIDFLHSGDRNTDCRPAKVAAVRATTNSTLPTFCDISCGSSRQSGNYV